MDTKSISDAVIKRLPRYYRYLTELKNSDVERISSSQLSKIMRVTASQIRQDFNYFGGFGQQGYGYNVDYLRNEIAKILGIFETNNIIIIGAGNLGCAIAGYEAFETRNFIVKGLFDSNEKLIGKEIRGKKIMSMDSLKKFIKENDIQIAALTVPKLAAPEIADTLYGYGIRAFWNFAHVDLNLPDDAYSENVHLSDSLMQLTFKLNMKK